MQTSQAPVREAIRCLELMGFVDHKTHVGARIKSFNRQEFIEVYEIREALEVFAARTAQGNLKTVLKRMKRCLKHMEAAAARADVATFSDHNTRFHRAIVEALGNQAMLNILDTLAVQEQMAASMHRANMSMAEALEPHYPIAEAIEAGSWDEVCDLISRHYRVVKDRI